MECANILEIIKDLKRGFFKSISKEKISEQDLLYIAEELKKDNYEVRDLIDIILSNTINENCDWNIGSILQHFDYNDIINALEHTSINKRGYLYDSIGFCWAMGECPYKNEKVVEFLYEVINNGRNSESWWRAAFALEKITGKDAINNLKRSLKNHSNKSLEESLYDLTDKKNIINILLNANSNIIKEKIYPCLKERFNSTYDEKELINIIWLLGRLRLYDESMLKKSLELLETTDNYETKFYILQAMIDDPKPIYLSCFNKLLDLEDALIKKMAIAGLAELGIIAPVEKLEKMLQIESNPNVIASLSRAIYKIKK